MDRTKAKKVLEVFDMLLKEHRHDFEQLGIAVKTGKLNFDTLTATLRISIIETVDDSGKNVNVLEERWNEKCANYGLKKEWLGKEMMIGAYNYTIMGLDPKKRAKPVVLEREGTRERFIGRISHIKRYFEERGM